MGKYEDELERIRRESGNAGGGQGDHGPIQARESAWEALTVLQREIQYNRDRKCDHEYKFPGPSWSAGFGPYDLRTAYSFDPYAHTAHMIPHIRDGNCECQMCMQQIGIERGKETKVNEQRVRDKLNRTPLAEA